MSDIRDRVFTTVSGALGVDRAEIADDSNAETVAAWDSFHHIEIIMALESEFKIRVPLEVIAELRSCKAIEVFVREHTGAE